MSEPNVISSPIEMTALIRWGVDLLGRSGISRPQWTAEQLLAERLGCLPVDLYVQAPAIGSEDRVRFHSDVAARANGVPLQYLLGTADFYGRSFHVGPGVFIPRPETEVVVDVALELLRGGDAGRPEQAVHPSTQLRMNGASKGHRPVAVDVGTGSGILAITLAAEVPGLVPVAVELSSVALRFARRNAARHECAVRFIQGDLLEGFAADSVDLIMANPPYLNPEELSSWPRELVWEPILALSGGSDGMDLIARLLRQARQALGRGGWILLEIGMGQGQRVQALAEETGFRVEQIVPDMSGIERVVALWKS